METKKQQTAVEWLVNEFFTKNGMQVTKESNPALFEVVEKAKAMEKEQAKELCFETIRTCDEPIEGTLNDYFEKTWHNSLSKKDGEE